MIFDAKMENFNLLFYNKWIFEEIKTTINTQNHLIS